MPTLLLVNRDAVGFALQLGECVCVGEWGGSSATELQISYLQYSSFVNSFHCPVTGRGQRPTKHRFTRNAMPLEPPKITTISTASVNQADGSLKTDKRKVASKKAEM